MTKMIDVAKEIGSPSALTQDQGEIIYSLICDSFEKGQEVNLDFQNVESMISAFLNVAIGKLYGRYDEDTIKSLLHFTNFPSTKKSTLILVISNAKKYYSNTPAFYSTAKEVMGQ